MKETQYFASFVPGTEARSEGKREKYAWRIIKK